jgi:tRNA-Thr(GGU) m(6)t(6)A37 methyltransferase TsaA
VPGDEIRLRPIGRVVGGRVEAIDDDWGDIEATIELDERFAVDALAGLTDFSHLDVVFVFDKVADDEIKEGARRPRGREDWPLVGVFAQRNKARPNRIGVTTCELLGVDGRTIRVRGLDAIDGTPVLDIKPYVTGFAPRSEVREPTWIQELMRDYW